MNSLKLTQRLKIIGAMIFAFTVVMLGSPRVFVADTPQIQGEAIAFWQYLPQRVMAFVQHPSDGEKQQSIVETAQIKQVEKKELEYKPVMKGVSAAEDPETKEQIVKIDPGTKLEIRYITADDGSKIKVFVPVE
jgi:hypothetical protein